MVLDVFPLIYTDKLGYVDHEERDQFQVAFTSSEGKKDKVRPRISRLYKLVSSEHDGLYLVSLERQIWHENSQEDDGMGGLFDVPDPRFYTEDSYWLVNIRSALVYRFREGSEFYALRNGQNQMPDCCDDDIRTLPIDVIGPITAEDLKRLKPKPKLRKRDR